MDEVSYAPLIQDMVWSYSRIKTFEACNYRWYLKYIKYPGKKWGDTFFATYGSFMHELIDLHYKDGLTSDDMQDKYLLEFRKSVLGLAPSQKVFENYFTDGLQYLKEFESMPFALIETEKKVSFDVAGIPVIGYIDYLGKDGDDLVIVDNKSRALKTRSNRKKPTKTDLELDDYLRQLYFYSAAVKHLYGKFPKWLCFNCFRKKTLIKEPFREEAYEEAERWLSEMVNTITNTTRFRPNIEWFKCEYLCECKDSCHYYDLYRK